MVICRICNNKFFQVTNTHLATHGLSPSEYKTIYHETSLLSDETRTSGKYHSWNKGKTKVTDQRLAVIGANISRSKKGKAVPKISLAKKGKCSGANNPFYKHKFSEETLKRISRKGKKHTGDLKRFGNRGWVGRHHTLESRKLISQKQKGRIKTREEWLKTVHSSQREPNRSELRLLQIINTVCSQFKYNGDLSLGIVIDGLVPDFVNIDGKKQLIELFGDYWHKPTEEEVKKLRYAKVGFDCLVIWDHELNDEKAVVAKIKKFVGG